LEHTKGVVNFIRNRLLAIRDIKDTRTGSVQKVMTLHPKLLGNGLQELARVSAEARNILVNYFKSCDDVYQAGVREVNASRSKISV
jgi:hypothetical protein